MHTKDLRVLRAVPVVVVVALALGCAGPKMALPPGVAQTSELLEVTDRSDWSGSLTDESFKLGTYAVKDVDRDWDSTSGFSFGPYDGKKATAGFKYRLAGGGPTLKGKCASETKEKSWDLTSTAEIHWGGTSVACTCEGGGEAATLTWTEKTSELSVSGTTYELEPIYETDTGAQVSEPVGFSARAGSYLGAVEVSRPGRVWLDKGLDPKTKAKASCLFAGLILYQPPTVAEDADD